LFLGILATNPPNFSNSATPDKSSPIRKDIYHGLNQIHVIVGPPGEHGDLSKGIPVNSGIKSTCDAATPGLYGHSGKLEAKCV
jgi:hypothetical protein